MAFFGYNDRAHAVESLGEDYVRNIELTGILRKRVLTVATRGRGYGQASWYPKDENGRERFSYGDKHLIVDYGSKLVDYTYTVGKDEFSWSEMHDEGFHRATILSALPGNPPLVYLEGGYKATDARTGQVWYNVEPVLSERTKHLLNTPIDVLMQEKKNANG